MAEVPGGPNELRQLIDQLRRKAAPVAVLLANRQEEEKKVMLIAGLSRDLVERGLGRGRMGSRARPRWSAAAAAAGPTWPKPAANFPKDSPKHSPPRTATSKNALRRNKESCRGIKKLRLWRVVVYLCFVPLGRCERTLKASHKTAQGQRSGMAAKRHPGFTCVIPFSFCKGQILYDTRTGYSDVREANPGRRLPWANPNYSRNRRGRGGRRGSHEDSQTCKKACCG